MSLSTRFAAVVFGCGTCLLTLSLFDRLFAQEPNLEVRVQGGAIKVVPPSQPVPPGAAPPAPQVEPPKEGQPPGQPGAAPGKAEAKPGEKPAEPGRPRRKPTGPANPEEMQARPGSDGRITFSFRGQDWEDVLEWLADICEMSLQMEEVPPGYLNLTSRGRYTVEQVRDLINSALINKGYTLLVNGEVLLVSKLKDLDKSLVPRVDPEDLDQRGTYEFVKSFFDLDSLVAETIADELKAMLSPHGKIAALKTTNRLDVLETAGNMRRIRDFLAEEQSDRGKQNLLREFRLQFTRASAVLEMLNTILGLDQKHKAGPPAPMNPEQMAQMQQAAMMAMQEGGGRPPGQPPAAPKVEPKIFLAINKQENSILANAPPDKMSIIEQAVKAIDLPKNKSESLLANLPRLRSYKLSSVDPAAIVKVLDDLGNLDPHTKLEVDARSRSIIAYATPIDHITIQAIVDKIDGTGRKFEVVQLYVLEAENVAGSIEFLMRGPEEKSSRSRYSPFFYDFGMGGPSRGQDRDPADQLQVEADSERNRLLIRATDSEMKEIRQLLAKLGELPDDDRGRQTMRVVPMSPGDMQTLIDRIRDVWPSVAPNQLKIAPIETPANGTEEEKPDSPPRRRTESNKPDSTRTELVEPGPRGDGNHNIGVSLTTATKPTDRDRDRARAIRPSQVAAGQVSDLLVDAESEIDDSIPLRRSQAADADNAQPQRTPSRPGAQPPAPPIAISPGPHGLVITSQDTEALDQLERMIGELAPTQRISSKLFYLKNSFCKDVADVLKDIFKEDDGKKSPNPYFDDMYYYYRFGPGSRDQAKERGRLSKRKQLKFVPEPVTNTLLVIGADASQLADVERLIKIYDEGVRPDSNAVRVTKQLTFHYTTAREVSEVIKDVFRDLLSPNDKAMAKAGQQQQQEQAKAMYSTTYIFGDDSKQDNARKFKGLLSLGVDDRSNTLTVSAPKDMMTIITEIAEDLDKAAGESRGVVSVLKVGTALDSGQLQKPLSGVGKSPASATPQSTPEQPPGVKAQPQVQPIRSETIVIPE